MVLSHAISLYDNYVEYVNILGGTNSAYDFSHGSTLPLITRPWAFNSYAPITNMDDQSWWFKPSDKRIYGLRVTHQPSPWIGDYGNFLIAVSMPIKPNQSKKQDDANNKNDNSFSDYSGYNPSKCVFKPYLFETSLLAYSTAEESTKIAFTSTNHGGIVRINFPAYDKSDFLQTRRVSIKLNGGNDTSTISTSLIPKTLTISGKSTANRGGVADNFAHYFVIAIYHGEFGAESASNILDSYSSADGARIDLSAENPMNEVITIRFATSLISLDQAIVNLETEVFGRSFIEVMEESREEWNNLLSRVAVQDINDDYSEAEKRNLLSIFYTSLYRASLFPRQLSEYSSSGDEMHWSPYDGKIYAGPLSTDSGFWDAFHTVYPLQYLINPSNAGRMIAGWLTAYQEAHWLPKWSSPGSRSSMVGTMGDVSLADAIVKGITGFNRSLAYESIRKDAYEIPDSAAAGLGRDCLASYLQHGYIAKSSSCDQIVSRTMNYWQSDYAIAQAAKSLGYEDDYEELLGRSQQYPSLFDFKSKLFRARSLDPSRDFDPAFDEFAWGGDYTEAGPYQYKFYIPYDAPGLAKLYRDRLDIDICEELDALQMMSAVFHVGSYEQEIHEQTEFAINCWGQYSHNNQPSHYMLYMFAAVDVDGYQGSCARKGQAYIREALSSLYHADVNMFPGDEDNGEMGSWYVLSSLGLYALSPGSMDYVFGSPLFARVAITLDQGKELIIEAKNNSRENVYVSSIGWNDQPFNKSSSISYALLRQGGRLSFQMTS
jgi:predicted alpha-1,2-mannosidase